ncbi:MAG: SpoIID/LytB domain-containing protein [Chloroflexi bacterium]|nr:SpoIID/LytB domain-containing protein [Chloroflexota bacterium]
MTSPSPAPPPIPTTRTLRRILGPLLALAMVLSAIPATIAPNPAAAASSAKVSVPKVRGMTPAKAKEALKAAGLKVHSTDLKVAHATVAKGKAVNTKPSHLLDGAPRKVARGTTVQLKVSTGPATTGPGTPSTATQPGEFRFVGRGTDHGVGLSQWGARGRALAGQAANEIVTHYFPGTTIGTVKTETTSIRVNIVPWRALPTLPVDLVQGKGGKWRIAGEGETYPAGATLAIVGLDGNRWKLRVRKGDGTVLTNLTLKRELVVEPVDPDVVTFAVPLLPADRRIVAGSLRISGDSNGRVRVIDTLPMERYLKGVVPKEMPSAWPQAALRAQAIVARSYAWKARDASAVFDVYADSRSQVYRGVKAETAAASAAVDATSGKVVKYGSSVAQTFYHSASGGATEDSWRVFTNAAGAPGTKIAYLKGVTDLDPDGRPWDAGSPYDTWQTRKLTLTTLGSIMARDPRTDVGTLTAIDLSDRGSSGRLTTVTLVGAKGTKRVAGWLFKSVFNTYRGSGSSMSSTWLSIQE